MGRLHPELRVVRVEAVGKLDDRSRVDTGVKRRERLLGRDQVVELPRRQVAAAQQLPRIPLHAGGVDKPMAGRQPPGDRDAQAEPPSLEREETHDRPGVGEHGDPGLRTETADRDRELGRQERIDE